MSLKIFVDEIGDDELSEIFADVKNVVFESHLLGHVFGLENGIHAATAFFLFQASL